MALRGARAPYSAFHPLQCLSPTSQVPPLAARYFGDLSVLLAKVEEAVRVMQDNDVAVQQAIGFAFILHKARFLRAIIVHQAVPRCNAARAGLGIMKR